MLAVKICRGFRQTNNKTYTCVQVFKTIEMLSPEVWNFKPPPCDISTKHCSSEEDIFRTIKHQYFNHHVSIILPDTVQIPKDLISPLLDDSQYYRVNDISPAEFTNKFFVDYFVKKGQLTAVSLNETPEQNSLVITPCGKLILSLTKSTYQGLGVEGTFTKHTKSALRKYIVVLDLASSSNESKGKRELAHKKLCAYKNLNFDIVLSWEPEDPLVCPSSIALYYSEKNYFVKACDVAHQQKISYNVQVPLYDKESDVQEFIQWLGAFTLECDMSKDDYISSLKCPEKSHEFGQVTHLTFTGLITHRRLKNIISEINKYIKTKNSFMWISLTVQSFQDIVLSVRNGTLFLSSGDHHCTIIFNSNHPPLVYSFQDKNK